MKFDYSYQEKIRLAETPLQAKILGNSKRVPLRDDWENIKDDIMFDAVRAKFKQHSNLKKLILDTENSLLIEHTKKDSYWGTGKEKL